MRSNNILKSALAIAIAITSSIGTRAQDSKLSPAARMELYKYEQTEPSSRSANSYSVLATIRLDGNRKKAIEEMEAEGAEIVRQFGSFAIAKLPIDAVRRIAASEGVVSMSFGETAQPTLVKARDAAKVNPVCEGQLKLSEAEPIPAFKGAGTVTGIYDTGFDTRHIDFTDNEGNCRIKQFSLVKTVSGQDPSVTVYDTPEGIYTLETDDNKGTHGTHVAGIMSGSYNGIGEAASASEGENPRVLISKKVPYYGVATESDIVMGGGSMTMSGILVGVSDAIEYGKATGQPVVVNLSLGSNMGPHDGSTDFSEALAELGEEGIIVIAAGNEGEKNIAIRGEISTETPTVKSFFEVPTEEAADNVQVWIMTPYATRLKGALVIYDTILKKELARVELSNAQNLGFGDGTVAQSGLSNPSSFSSNFSGGIYGFDGFHKNSNRGMVFLQTKNLKSKGSKNISIGIEVSAPTGTKIYGYTGDDMPFTSQALPGWINGTPNGSVSDMACGKNVICVGAFVSGRNVGRLDKKSYYYPAYILGNIAPFSSYGELMNGTKLPHITAPGATVISAISTPYAKSENLDPMTLQAEASSVDGRINYWHDMSGTSQATPMVSGIVSLMLNADPTLKFDEVLSILQKTAVKDEYVDLLPLRWGAGKIDASAAVKEVMARKSGGIEGISTDPQSGISVSSYGREFTVSAAGAAGIEVIVTDITGQQAIKERSSSDTANVSCQNLSKGIYVMSVATTDGRRHTRKITVN